MFCFQLLLQAAKYIPTTWQPSYTSKRMREAGLRVTSDLTPGSQAALQEEGTVGGIELMAHQLPAW